MDDNEAKVERQGIHSVEVAMQVLRALEEAGGPAPLSRVAKLAGLPANKTHRYLVSLVRVELAEQEDTSGLYNLGAATRRLGVEALRRGDEVSLATKHTIALRDATLHTANLSTWSDAGPTIVRWDYGAFPLPITVRVGSTLPLVDSSVGRVFLAYSPGELTTPVLRQQQRRFETSTPSSQELDAILDEVREQGFSITSGGVIPGLSAIAAPVFGSGPGLLLVIGVAVPTRDLTATTQKRLVASLTETTAKLTWELGGRK